MNSSNTQKLIIVSNRLPLKRLKKDGRTVFAESDGGLVSSLRSYLEDPTAQNAFNEIVWIGAADFSEKSWQKFTNKAESKSSYRIEPLFIDERVFDGYYNGFSNATLWPLFHYFPSFTDFDERSFTLYEEVNTIFKNKLATIAEPGDTIWIHDYHLMLLPAMVRKEVPKALIGFFLHIPFPNFEVFRLMHSAWKKRIVDGLLGADLIGFHTSEYLQHFLKTMRMVSGFDHRFREIIHRDGFTKADVFPLGIDFVKFHDTKGNPGIQANKKAIAEQFSGSKIIFSVDRLDYTKGVTHRLAGFERFLELHPEWRSKVVFIMVVVPSRQIVSKYNERRKLIEEQVGRINGKYSTIAWQPIIYRYNALDFDELCALYQQADVALITPLRDGMNLVAKEYVASRVNHDGVLILSELAGAAAELGEATMVNPTDRTEVAKAIHDSLIKPEQDQSHDIKAMQARLEKNNVAGWVDNFLSQLVLTRKRQEESTTTSIDTDVRHQIIDRFRRADRRLLLLDYDGTLTPIESHPGYAHPSKQLLNLLLKLSAADNTDVVVVSGRNHEVLAEWLGFLPVHLVGEHGASIRARTGAWQHFTDIDTGWKSAVRSTLESFTDRAPGSFIEEKKYTMAWHYRSVNEDIAFRRSRELLDNLYNLARNTHLNVLDGKKVIEIRAAGIDKGIAARRFQEMFPSDFVLAAGDDKTDEDIFSVLDESAITIKIGSGVTAAKYRMSCQNGLFELLDELVAVK